MKKGFSIVELLVVIGIIALLSAIGIMTFSNSQKRAREARRISDVGQISSAIQQYISLGNAVPSTSNSFVAVQSGPLDVLVSSGLLASVPVENTPQGTAAVCTDYLYSAPTGTLATQSGPGGVIGTRQYALTFHSEVATAAGQTHPMNSSLITIAGTAPSTGCGFYIAYLLGPK